jgi:hypothetical protein
MDRSSDLQSGTPAEHTQALQHTHAAGHQDAVSTYFECITACSLDDGACVSQCVEVLREQP